MPDSYLQRAELLADLGRYDEAAAELAEADPDDAPAHTLLARIRLATGDPRQALVAADAAVTAAPGDVPAMVARGMALADLGRVDEAAAQAEQILRRGRGDGYACTSAAAILAEVRNGQIALDAAWEGVRLTPDQPRAHLVLGVIAARLGLDDVAERAYREALTLDPQLLVAQSALGMVRQEQHQYAAALSRFAGARSEAEPAEPADPVEGDLRRTVQYGAGYALVAPLLVAGVHVYGVAAELVAALLAGLGIAGTWLVWRRMPDELRDELPELLRTDRGLMIACWAVVSIPSLLLIYALLGSPWPLVLAVAAGAVALFAVRQSGPSSRTG